MTAEGPKAGLTHSRSLIVDRSVIVPALTPAHRHASMLVTACVEGSAKRRDALEYFADALLYRLRASPTG